MTLGNGEVVVDFTLEQDQCTSKLQLHAGFVGLHLSAEHGHVSPRIGWYVTPQPTPHPTPQPTPQPTPPAPPLEFV